MSSPATSTFLTWWRNNATRAPITLALIEIATPSAVTLRVASREVTTPDGNTWEAGLKSDPLRARLGMLEPGPSPADATIYLANRLYPFMSSGVVTDTLQDYQWQGATVTLYLWNDVRDSTGAQRLAWADALCVFEAGRVDSYEAGDAWLKLSLLQDQSWNNPVPPTSVDKLTYPNAPDVSQGRPIPILYGDHIALPMRSPWTTTYGSKSEQEDAGAGQGAVPGILVDPGLGADSVKVVYAGHACADLLSRSTGYSQFIAANDVLAPLDTTGITESASDGWITIDDDTLIAYYGVRPLEPRATYNTADNSRRAADPFDETSYATIDQNTSKNVVELTLPSVASLGYIEEVTVRVAFVGNAGNGNTLRVRPQIPGSTSYTAVTSTLGQAQSTTPVILSGTWDTTVGYGQTWQFGGVTSGSPIDLKVEFTGGTTNTARILWAVLRVKFRPQRSLVTPAYVAGGFFAGLPLSPYTQAGRSWEIELLRAGGSRLNPALLQVQGQFFANVKGYADDGSGTYTGSAAALIQRPCDILHHFLVTYGGVSGADVETGAATFGSFVAARDTLRNAEPSDFKLACWIGNKTSVQRTIQDIASQSLGCVLLDRFSGKWLFHVWRRGPASDYDLAFTRTELPDLFETGVLSDVGLAQGVRVRWAMDYFKGRTLFETFVTADGSSQGYAYPSVRDQALIVSAGVNDDFDWSRSGTFADVLTAGTYTPIELAQEMQTQMRTHEALAFSGYGFDVVENYNDALNYQYSAVTYVGTIAPGSYTADEFAQACEDALNATASGLTFTVAYNYATNAFTATASASVSWRITLDPDSGWPTFGVTAVSTATSVTGGARYFGRFWWAHSAAMSVLTSSGASAATGIGNLVGQPTDKSNGVGGVINADYARNDREAQCAASEAAFGPRADTEVVAGWIRDESSAQRLRDGIFDFGSTPPVWLKFRSHACPDMRRMAVFECDADMDERRAYPGYGSDGSWAGKRFRALEIEQDMGPSYHTEVYALEA